MGLIQRVRDLLRANIHAAAEQAEDPQQVIDQYITETTQHMVELNLEVSRATQELIGLQTKAKTRRDEALGWQRQAEAAVLQNKDDLARAALARKAGAEQAAAELETQLPAQQTALDTLKHAAGELQAKLDEAKRKRDELLTRQHRAEALVKAGDAVSKLEQDRAQAALRSMAERTAEKEAQAEVATQPADPLEAKFRELEKGGG